MPKAYWISAYRAMKDPSKLAAYAKLAGPALASNGGRFLARGEPANVFEEAPAAVGDGAEREIRIIEGV